ncbi:hypothetical protein LCGC14_0530850 [marine sediment metagenome]|uniref:Uncharacterized protein n=1 Tax=marine sediment metagenome TaxID=412755 RepID=A0A0F9SE21_9ZZZZ
MDIMNDQDKEDFEKKFDENGFDPTKDAFFSDLMGMEEEIATEAYQLVEHALNLIESKFFDDGIEILRQAIGVYAQINREEEIKAINEKIAEVYLLKEKSFREGEMEALPQINIKTTKEESSTTETEVEAKPIRDEKSVRRADQLINEVNDLLNSKKFEEALDKYDGAIEIYEEHDKSDEIDHVYKLIEEVYNQKAEFLRNVKKETPELYKKEEIEEEIEIGVTKLKEEELQRYLVSKKREEEISVQAYDLLGKAAELAKLKDFNKAIQLYTEGANLFRDMNWTYEVKKVQDTISQLELERKSLQEGLVKQRSEVKEENKTPALQVKEIEQQLRVQEEQEKHKQIERLREIELQKMEDEFFKAQIDNMATEASVMAREYELAMQKAIKKGEIIDECAYPKVIEIYKKMKKLLIDKGWNTEATIYNDTINIYIQKFDQDKKIRQIEIKKANKQRESKEMLKVSKQEETVGLSEEQLQKIEDQRKKELEVQTLREKLDDMSNKAERLSREYEVALRKGSFKLKCPYPEIINIYLSARQIAIEKGWETETLIYLSQIQAYTEKLEKDKRLREIEAEKIKKQKDFEDTLKVKQEEKALGLDIEKLRVIEEQKKGDKEEEEFKQIIEEMVKKADRMAREYELAMKKAVRQGKLAENPPFAEVVRIYERVKQMAIAKGKNDDTIIYDNQIKYYSQKWEKDNVLREIDAKKLQKQQKIEDLHKVKGETERSKRLLKVMEKKKEEEDFEKTITDQISIAEKMVRDYEISMRKALRKGEILENTPYLDVIEIYKDLREKVLEQGWKEQARIYSSQIRIYQDKLEKHEKIHEIEKKKAVRKLEIEDMHKIKEVAEENKSISKFVEKKKEEEDFEKSVADQVNIAEKLVRDHEISMRKALRKGDVLESTPYLEVIEIYKQIREKVFAKGWKEQAEVYANQIKIYMEKLEKHEKLFEIEAQKAQRQKDLESMHKADKIIKVDIKKSKGVERKKEDQKFQDLIIQLVNKAEKLEREHDSIVRKALKKGEIVENNPYPQIINIYDDIKAKLLEKGWSEQATIYSNQIKIYKEKLKRSEVLQEVEAKKAERQKGIDDMHKMKKEFKPVKRDKIEAVVTEEDLILDEAMKLIDDAERAVKKYELSIKTDVLLYKSPYKNAIANYKKAKDLFQKIGWNDEASQLISTIKFYKEKLEKDENLREIEKSKLEKPEEKWMVAKVDTEKELFGREKRISEYEQKKKKKDKLAEGIFNEIHKAERLAKDYEFRKRGVLIEQEAPYEDILEIYRVARKSFEEIGWMEESMKLISTVQFYKEKFENDNKLRALERRKEIERDDALKAQQNLLHQAREEQEKLVKTRKENQLKRKANVDELETIKGKAFILMDQAKAELEINNFDKAIELYNQSEAIFSEISWKEGINMIKDSITTIKRRKQSYELEQKTLEEEKLKRLETEAQLEDKFAKAEELRKLQQEEKRKEFLKVQSEKQREREKSEEAYAILEQGTILLEYKKFDEAYEKYVEARKIFNQISWKQEVSRINNDLLFKLKRERKTFEVLKDIKEKKVEEDKAMEELKKETEKQRRDLEKSEKEEKRKLAKEGVFKKILKEIERAESLFENFKFNEGILLLKEQHRKLEKGGKREEIKKIDDLIKDIKNRAEVPIIVLENIEQNDNFKAGYKALDSAQTSLSHNQFMKVISELKEAKFNLHELKINKKHLKEIEEMIKNMREKLGRKPTEKDFDTKTKEHEADMEMLRSRISKRREERRKKVLDLLKEKTD